jgi:hypothetical protein
VPANTSLAKLLQPQPQPLPETAVTTTADIAHLKTSKPTTSVTTTADAAGVPPKPTTPVTTNNTQANYSSHNHYLNTPAPALFLALLSSSRTQQPTAPPNN